jgi:hypothetical protein
MAELSPAAQVVLDAAMQYEINPECYSREIAAAALRAAADQIQFENRPGMTVDEGHAQARRQILAIAAELDNTSQPS